MDFNRYYADWITRRVAARRGSYAAGATAGEPGLLSFLTTVWNTPLDLLRPAVDSLLGRQTMGDFQWVVLDNGSTDDGVVRYLREAVASDGRVVFLRAEQNLGIVGGMNRALSAATGRYALPFDSDDLLYPDAVAVLTHLIRANGYPAALYSDEDKVGGAGGDPFSPYFKPGWDPVLFLNSCYIAHLGCFDRRRAIALGVYTDPACEGCHDWDTFTRFLMAGHAPVHVPEVLYSWRAHANSTAQNIASKYYVFDSHRAVLTRFLVTSPHRDRFELRLSPLFGGNPDWWFERKPQDLPPIPTLLLSEGSAVAATPPPPGLDNAPQHRAGGDRIGARSDVRTALPGLAAHTGLVCITFDTVRLNQPLWQQEVTGLFELHPDTVMVGGRVVNSAGRIVEAGRVAGFNGLFGAPDHGRAWADPGNLAEIWKQRSVSGVSTHACVVRADFLREVIETFSRFPLSWFFLGAWAALLAWRTGRRVVYTPFLVALSDLNPDAAVGADEALAFLSEAADFLPDLRYYNPRLSRFAGQAYLPVHHRPAAGQ